MSLFRVYSAQDTGPVIAGNGIMLRTPSIADFEEWAVLRARSRNFLTPWEPKWPADDLTRGAFRRRLRRYQSEIRDDHAYPFFIFQADEGTLLGGVTVSNIARGMTQSATIGYWMGEEHAGRGHMEEALKALVPFAFRTLNLHRLEAACLPNNARSIRLLEKLGFQREGLARGLVCINGQWRDHIVFALLNGDPWP
jgi:ribosomal-protein-alanine N-acetyltransferase